MPLSRALLSLSATTLVLSVGAPSVSRHQTPSVASPTSAGPDSSFLANYKWRNIGPDRGGRSIAVSGVKGHPKEAYFGATGGGLWKTTDGGETWKPVTDGQVNSASVGAVAVSQSDPNIVYIGMGESCIRGNIMPGDGVYRSTDAGKTWTHVGFNESDGISKIRIHPTNPNVVFVASFGKYSVPSTERGVYKSSDGGRTWRRVLYRDDKSGAIDITIDPSNPQVMYAALWEAYRNEYHMSSGGPGSGLFKSTDGGETWTEITRNAGMPAGVIGRIGVAAGPDGKRVYALVENENGGLFSSDDAGATWKLVNDNRAIRQRAFYYTHVFADPKNADVVYLQNTTMFRSTDGGKTTKSINNGTHGDFHDLWIDPDDPTHLVVGNDGGGAVSMNTGGKWTDEDYPTEQFYHIAATKHIPYHVCGAQQDNSTLCIPFDWNANRGGRRGGDASGPSDPTQGGMAEAYVVGGGEPGYIAPDPRDPDQFYSGANNGSYLDKYNRRLGTSREVNPYPWFYSGEPSSAIRERWQWTYPILFSPVDPKTLYVSSQRLWKTTDGGQTWTALSGDLTRHDPKTMGHSGGPITGDMNGPEVYGVIFSVGPSKRDVNVIWTGSDDGLVHVTRDGGKTWTNVTPSGMPEFGRVSQIDASAFETGRAYVSVRRPLLDDRSPYIFRTADYGRTWTKIVNGLPRDAYVHVVREDSTKRGLLYAGTQHGVYVSYDDGASWQSLALNMPDVPVADLIVQGNELVIATHGRGFWALDNIAPLRQWTPTVASQDLHLFTPPQAVRSGPALVLSWYSKQAPKSTKLEILDSTGTVLRTMVPDSTHVDSLAKNASHADSARVDSMRTAAASVRRYAGGFLPKPMKGLNNVSWDLRAQGVESFPGMILWGAGTAGPALPPGHYTVRLSADAHTASAPVTIVRNPRLPVTDADLRAQYAFSRKVRDRATEANRRVVEIRRVKSQLEDRYARANDLALHAAGDTLSAHASAVEEKIYQVRNRSGQDPLNFPIRVNNRLATLLSMNEQGDGRPTNNMDDIFGILTNELTGYETQLRQIWRTDLVRVNGELTRLSLPPLDPQCTEVKGCAARP
jgi:photosystem II stability/assembly factor-like uncharacterized protein